MIDGESHVQFDPVRGVRSITIYNTERELIDACAECCDVLGVRYSLTERAPQRPGCKKQWWLSIHHQQDFLTLAASVPIRSQRRASLLRDIVTSYKRKPYKRREVALA